MKHITGKSYAKLKGKYTHVKPFEYAAEANYFKFAEHFRIFNEDGDNISDSVEWSATNSRKYRARFLIRVYVIYVYDNGNSVRKMKLVMKLEQMKLFPKTEKEEEESSDNDDHLSLCLL